ncbi:hypothetical protein [Amycolatopsis sp. NPDC051071]|uniref:hypothetical protein n=1 Tax=Amycolatopsis sp. NPDC051071 TaxID=3154637 RepID=UPI003413D4EC
MSDPQRPAGDDDKTVEQPAETTAETPADAAPAASPPPAAAPPAAAVPPQQPPKKGGFHRFAAARATQLVAVGLLGFLLGGGIIGTAVGLAVGDRHDDRPGISREHRGPDRHGPMRDFHDGDRGHRNDGN